MRRWWLKTLASPVRVRVPPLSEPRNGFESGRPAVAVFDALVESMMDRDKNSGARFGCLGLVLELGGWVISVTLVTLGALVFLVGALTSTPSFDVRAVIPLMLAPVGIYVLVRVGRAIIRDMRDPK